MKHNKPNKIENIVESLYPFSKNSLYDDQSAKSPRLVNLGLMYQNSYYLDGRKYHTYEDDCIVYLAKQLPLDYKLNKILFTDYMNNMVKSQKCKPFLLFINGLFIKWSNIEIICDTYYNYIKIHNINNPNKEDKIDTISLPKDLEYIEKAYNATGTESFIFDKTGKLVFDIVDDDTTIIDLKDPNLSQDGSNIQINKKIQTSIDNKYIIDRSNIFIFDELFESDREVEIHPKNIIELKEYEDSKSATYKVFYNRSLYNKDNITKLSNNQYIVNKILKDIDTDYIYDLSRRFNFEYDKSISRSEWLLKSIKYILSYNIDLISDHIYEMSNIYYKTFKGSDLLGIPRDENYIYMSRRFNECLETGIMVFKNGILFEDHDKIEYKDKDFKFPLDNIKDDDIIDIYYFLNIDNNIINLPFKGIYDNQVYAIGPKRIEDMKLYTSKPNDMKYDIGYSEDVKYEVEYTYNKVSDGLYNIYPINCSTYRTVLDLVSNRQFRYMRYNNEEGDTIKVPLTKDFKYCNDENKYIIFINGIRINKDNYRITIPKNTRPFDSMVLYINIPILLGDRVDIFYTSDELQEIYYNAKIENQSIIVDMSKLSYALNPKLYMFFLNGKKLDIDDLDYIDYNIIKINPKNNQINSINNLSVLQYIDSKDIIKDLFKGNDYLTEIISKLSNDEIDSAYSIDGIVNDIDPNMKDKELSMRSIMYEVVKDFWCRPYINKGIPFVYDYDITNFYNYDKYDNVVINVLNAMMENKIDII